MTLTAFSDPFSLYFLIPIHYPMVPEESQYSIEVDRQAHSILKVFSRFPGRGRTAFCRPVPSRDLGSRLVGPRTVENTAFYSPVCCLVEGLELGARHRYVKLTPIS